MADLKISQLTAKGTTIAATDLIEISESDGAGGYVTKSVTGANITSGVSSVTATTPVVATGTTTPVISLASSYGDTQNPYGSKTANHILAAPNGTAGVPTFRAIVGADIPTLNQNTTGTAANVTGIVAVANGGTGTATPSLVAGTGVTITGTFPNQTINSSGGGGGGTEIGAQIGGGIVVAVFNDAGVNKALVASLTNLSTGLPWSPVTALLASTSFYDGLTNTNAIIAQTGAAATTAYAAGIARLFAGGAFTDWYLPSLWELNTCYNSAPIVNKILGSTNGFQSAIYWSSTQFSDTLAYRIAFDLSGQTAGNKSINNYVRAVRIHTI